MMKVIAQVSDIDPPLTTKDFIYVIAQDAYVCTRNMQFWTKEAVDDYFGFVDVEGNPIAPPKKEQN